MSRADGQGIDRSRRAQVSVVLVALLLGSMYASVELASSGWDPAGVITFGREDLVRVEYAESTFGRDIPLSDGPGHDGRFFLIQSMDPLLLSPESHGRFLDRPTYRAQRMVYPLLAGAAAPFGPDAVAWAMIVVNVLGFGAGTWATGRLASLFGISAWWGLTFALNPGVRFELDIDGAGVLAMAALMFGLMWIKSRRPGLGVAALAVAALSREVMLLAVVGVALAKGVGTFRRRVVIVAVPSMAVAVWWAYVHLRLSGFPGEAAVQEIGWPLRGFAGAFDLWLRAPGRDLVLGVAYLGLALLAVVRAVRLRGLLEMPMLGFSILSLFLTRQVWFQHFDISRAVAPIPTLLLLSLAVSLFGRGQRVDAMPEIETIGSRTNE